MSVLSETTDLEQPSVTEAVVGSPASRRMIRCWCHWSAVLTVLGLAACATHRHDPPQCKGPFTPINQTSAVVSHGP